MRIILTTGLTLVTLCTQARIPDGSLAEPKWYAHFNVELSEMFAWYNEPLSCNTISWCTESEQDNDFFTIERSIDAVNWTVVSIKAGAGNSTGKVQYSYHDHTLVAGEHNYYRLSHTDKNGMTEVFEIVVVDNSEVAPQPLKVFNSLGEEVKDSAKGLLILLYKDGSTKKVFRH